MLSDGARPQGDTSVLVSPSSSSDCSGRTTQSGQGPGPASLCVSSVAQERRLQRIMRPLHDPHSAFWWQKALGGTVTDWVASALCPLPVVLLSPLATRSFPGTTNRTGLQLSKESRSLVWNVSLLEVSLSSLTNLLCFATALVIYNHGNDAKSCACIYFGL